MAKKRWQRTLSKTALGKNVRAVAKVTLANGKKLSRSGRRLRLAGKVAVGGGDVLGKTGKKLTRAGKATLKRSKGRRQMTLTAKKVRHSADLVRAMAARKGADHRVAVAKRRRLRAVGKSVGRDAAAGSVRRKLTNAATALSWAAAGREYVPYGVKAAKIGKTIYDNARPEPGEEA